MSKACTRCSSAGPFGRNAASPDGLYSLCKVCRAETSKAYRERPEVKTKETERLSAQYANNRETLLVRRRERYLATRDETLAVNRLWSEQNKERHRALNRQWSKDNPEAARALVAARRARIKGAIGRYGRSDIQRMHDSQDGKCPCGAEFSIHGYHVDHVWPLSLGGSNGPENLQLLCPTCNRRKGAKTDYAIQVHC